MYALVDCNNFYASCERVFNPTLIGKPVIVLSNNDGCVIARSNEAKALGIKMGDPFFKVHFLIKKHNIAVYSSNFALYGDMSRRVMNILATYSPVQEIYSIDECFLDLRGIQADLKEYGIKMREHVNRWTGIPISVGIAPTKALAKVANRIAKKFPEETSGSHVIDSEEKRMKALKWLPIEDVWGIGRRNAAKLKAINVRTAYDFTLLETRYVLNTFTVVGSRLQKDLQGIPSIQMEDVTKKKSIATTRSFDNPYTRFEDLRERIVTFVSVAAVKMRNQQSLCTKLTVFIETSRFKDNYYSNSVELKLPFATQSTLELAEFALKGLERIFKKNKEYKRAGIILSGLVDSFGYQPSLFINSNPKHQPLMKAVDAINKKYGKQTVRLGTQNDIQFKMRREHLSQAYTTKIEELPEVII